MAKGFQAHVRNTFLAGIFAVVPIAVTIFIIYKVDEWTRGISQWMFGRTIPFVGALIAVAAIYLGGLVATVSAGKFVIRSFDSVLSSLPGLRQLYIAWKQIAITPGGGTEGVFSHVCLIPDETGATHLLGFTNGKSIENSPDTLCVFVPASPNPINGRLYFVARDKCAMVDLSTEEAFKIVLSTGNYVPPEIGVGVEKFIRQSNAELPTSSVPGPTLKVERPTSNVERRM